MTSVAPADRGVVDSIWRYPVKSMAGEELAISAVTERGLLGDRAYALVDTASNRAATGERTPEAGHERTTGRGESCGGIARPAASGGGQAPWRRRRDDFARTLMVRPLREAHGFERNPDGDCACSLGKLSLYGWARQVAVTGGSFTHDGFLPSDLDPVSPVCHPRARQKGAPRHG